MNDEFKNALKNIDTIYKRIKVNGENLLVYASVKEDNSRIFMIVTNILDYFWIDDFGAQDFEAHKKTIGLEGPLSDLIQLMMKAFTLDGNSLEVKFKKNFCELKIKYEVGPGVVLNGNFHLNERVTFETNNELAKTLYSQIIFNIIEYSRSMESRLKSQITEMSSKISQFRKDKENEKNDDNNYKNNKKDKSQTKIKPNSDLINPFKKKRKGGGVKIVANNINSKLET